MTTDALTGRTIELCEDRVRRAGEIRDEIGRRWADYLGEHPRRLTAVPGQTDGEWIFGVRTIIPMPVRLSTLFGEWLYELRAALDATAYYLAIRDSRQDPPPNERRIYFPIKLEAAAYDKSQHRSDLKALSDRTFQLLRRVQPFQAHPDHFSNALWWIEELARIDRHRRGHALAPHIGRIRLGLEPPITSPRWLVPESAPKRIPATDVLTPLLAFTTPAGWTENDVRDHVVLTEESVTSWLDVTEWADKASNPMRAMNLERRMDNCEQQILDGIILPLLTSEIDPSTASPRSGPAENEQAVEGCS
ncbi:hypothetical protein [Nocardia noduli]|uniref:hypothetical protein n=1 Tax=Nocardia noduli TaxID=2815722 RepID=UPI001C238997|nr:hypothetical protein [Nocardia noduli]